MKIKNPCTHANYILKKLGITKNEDGLYFLKTDDNNFEKITGRTYNEVFAFIPEDAKVNTVPLGYTAIDAVISLYGLSNSRLYAHDLFAIGMKGLAGATADQYNYLSSSFMIILKSAAYDKYAKDYLNDRLFLIGNDKLEQIFQLFSITPEDVVSAYNKLRG